LKIKNQNKCFHKNLIAGVFIIVFLSIKGKIIKLPMEQNIAIMPGVL
jgi:hypothetical protein